MPKKSNSSHWNKAFTIILTLASIIAGAVTYAALKKVPPLGNDPNTIIWLLNIDFIILLMIVGLVAYRIVSVWSGRKRGLAGSHLHVRLVYIFSMLAATPAIIMTVFSAFFFHFGVQTWFSEKIQTAINESQAVAQAYLEEHKQVIKADTLAMANDINRQSTLFIGNSSTFDTVIQTQSVLRNLSEAIVFDSSGRVLARSGLTFSLEFDSLPQFALEQAKSGDVVITTNAQDDRVRALVKLNSFIDSYLYVGRMVDQKVLSHLSATQEAVQSYKDLEKRYSNLQLILNLIFVIVGLLLVLVAVWFGLILARQLVRPIGDLITASDRVRGGDLSAQVDTSGHIEEFDYLGRAFNRMTRQIEEQQNELIQANRQLDRRRRLTETVLTGVSSGVIGVDNQGTITMANASALDLLDGQKNGTGLTGRKITGIIPALDELLTQAHENPKRLTQSEITLSGENGKKVFLARIAIELIGDKDTGAIVTLDDVTEFLSAQRKAAWADVARRIAHEIKNPLTPIQLSAERLKRRYLKDIQNDPEIFAQCTDTIVKHVEDIGRMVNEFSSFARMPEPVLKPGRLDQIIDESVSLQKQAHPEIQFNISSSDELPQDDLFDSQQIRQVLTNLLQNSIDSIYIRQNDEENKNKKAAKINIVLGRTEQQERFIAVTDNGAGFPKEISLASLSEPYITHKDKGTGLGLAIVKKIMEDHKGQLIMGAPDWLKNHEKWCHLKGATVVILLQTA